MLRSWPIVGWRIRATKFRDRCKPSGQIEWKKGIANGQLSIFGANLRMRDLVFTQLNSQCVIWNSVVYLNDASANLTGNDFVSANAIVDLRGSHRYSGKFRANVSDLSKLQPLLRTFGNQNELAGSLVVEWEGDGEGNKLKTGKLRLALDNGRYGSARSLQATADATYSPDGLDVPTIFLRSDKIGFSSDRTSQRRDAGDQQDRARSGTGEVCRRLHLDSARLEKSRDRQGGASVEWKSERGISI